MNVQHGLLKRLSKKTGSVSPEGRRDVVRLGRSGRKDCCRSGLYLNVLAKSACWVMSAFGTVCFTAGYAWAVSVDDNISKLEQKFFQHPYPKETSESRLSRLEATVFGEPKQGSGNERLQALLNVLSNLDQSVRGEAGSETANSPPDSKPATSKETFEPTKNANHLDEGVPIPLVSKYPAVTAIEHKLFGKDYGQEPIGDRLARLETKVFGKVSSIADLSERVDRLKQQTGIDIARQAPRGSDWAEEDDDGSIIEQAPPVARYGNGEDGKSFSGRNLREDFRSMRNRNYQGMAPSGSGAYGMGSSGVGGSYGGGRYGMSGQAGETGPGDIVPFAPPLRSSSLSNLPNQLSMAPQMGAGLNQQVSQLESEIFGKTYMRDPLPARLNRLESTVFPQEKPAVAKSLPDRVARLLSVVPISQNQATERIAQSGNRSFRPSPDFDNLDPTGSMPPVARPRGLGKIINSISNFFTGGFTGGYALPPGNLITDPSTGMLYDRVTGNLIDPNSGMVVGRRSAPGYSTGTGSISSFSSGFSPFGSFGTGGTGFGGMRFGFGAGQFGGMWP